MEEAQRKRRETIKKEIGDMAGKKEDRGKRGNPLGCFSRYTPLKVSRDQTVHMCDEDRADPKPSLPDEKHKMIRKFVHITKNMPTVPKNAIN